MHGVITCLWHLTTKVINIKHAFLFFVAGGSVYGDDNKVLDEVKPYSDNKSIIKKNHPLLIMVI